MAGPPFSVAAYSRSPNSPRASSPSSTRAYFWKKPETAMRARVTQGNSMLMLSNMFRKVGTAYPMMMEMTTMATTMTKAG